jgi:2-oxoacid:acceptor oxidoreductase delta subunit (pyruvate/2-ketoisovalerate family)
MLLPEDAAGRPPLYLPCSTTRTSLNRTGSWRYFRPGYQDKTSPCSVACPAGQDIAGIEMLGTRGLYRKAWRAILLENPFPAVCGRVCFHPCEQACNRAGFDEPVAVHALERFLGDRFLQETGGWTARRPASGRKVAIVGSGPAGLATACFLTTLGHACTVFESRPLAGGLLRHGIPAYRLPEVVVDAEIGRIQAMGVSLICNVRVDDRELHRLACEHDAVVIAAGCSQPVGMKIAGENMAEDGLTFLRRVRAGNTESISGPVAVVGGGNTALDVARSLRRLGAAPVIIYRRRRQDMPAFAAEVRMAEEEGVQLRELVVPVEIKKEPDIQASGGGGLRLTLQSMAVGGVADGGRARVIPREGCSEDLQVARVFTALGAVGDPLFQSPGQGRPWAGLLNCRLLKQNPPTLVIGDLAAQEQSVAHAVASAKEAALALDSWFSGGDDAVAPALAACRVGPGPALSLAAYLQQAGAVRDGHVVALTEINSAYFEKAARIAPAVLPPEDRSRQFGEITDTLATGSAAGEFARCFNCGRCNGCDNCRLFCPEVAVVLDKGDHRIDLDYCKGCGICVQECPRSAMTMEEEGT